MVPFTQPPCVRSLVAAVKLVFSRNVSGSFPYPLDTPKTFGSAANTPLRMKPFLLPASPVYGSIDTPTAPRAQHKIDTGCDARSARNSHSGEQFLSAGRAFVRHGNSPGRTCAALLSP